MPNKTDKTPLLLPTQGQPSTQVHLENPQLHVNENVEQKALKRLLQSNQKYLNEKVKVSDVPRPPKYSHKLPSRTGQSQYFRKYGQRGKSVSVPDKKGQTEQLSSIVVAFSNIVLPTATITPYQSTYHMDFPKKKAESVPRSPLSNIKYSRQEGPTFNETSYKRDFGAIRPSPTGSAKRGEVRLMGGGKLTADTTYHHNYRLKTEGYRPQQPIIQKNNNIFMSLCTPPQKSSYRETFRQGKKRAKAVESCKPEQKYIPSQSGLKYRTEYAGQFVQQPIKSKKEVECLSPEELKSYVLGILQ